MSYIKICVCTYSVYINAVSNDAGPLKKIILKDSGVMRSLKVSKTKAVQCDGEPGMEVREITLPRRLWEGARVFSFILIINWFVCSLFACPLECQL